MSSAHIYLKLGTKGNQIRIPHPDKEKKKCNNRTTNKKQPYEISSVKITVKGLETLWGTDIGNSTSAPSPQQATMPLLLPVMPTPTS